MSWYRQIKIIYTIVNNTFFFILWASALNGFFGGKVDYKLYLLSLFAAFSLVAIFERTKNIRLALAVSFILSEGMLFLLCERNDFIMNSIYLCFILFISYINESKDINYELYRYKAKQAIIILTVIGFIFTFTSIGYEQSILKFYIIFLIFASILMRETRSYYYRIRNNKSFITNFSIMIGILFISLDSVFNIIVVCLKYLIDIFYKLSDGVLNIITIIMRKPLEITVNFLGNKFFQNPNLFIKITGVQDKQQNGKNAISDIANNNGWPVWITGALRVIILLIIIYFAYKVLIKYKNNKSNEAEVILEERIKLSKEKTLNNNSIRKAIKNILKLGNLKEQTLNIYKKFQLKTNERGIFRNHMTAKQLENITKAYIENAEGLNDLTNIYNEVKFSKHNVTKEHVETIKESFNKVKKQL